MTKGSFQDTLHANKIARPKSDRWPKLSGEDAERTRGHVSQIRLHHEQYNGGTPPNVRFRMRARVFGPGWWTALLNRARPVSRDGIARRKEGIAMRSSIAVALAGIIARNDSGSGADCRPGPTGCGPTAVGRDANDSATARGTPAGGARRSERHRRGTTRPTAHQQRAIHGKVSTGNVTRGILSSIPYKAETLTAAANAGAPMVLSLG